MTRISRRAAMTLAFAPVLTATAAALQRYPNVVAVRVRARSSDLFDFEVTISSPYDSAQRYADAFRVVGPDGSVLGVRELLHDHAGEQPFTRDLYGVAISPGVSRVSVQARDRQHGWGGKTFELSLPGR